MITFFVPGIPATKGSWRALRNGKLCPDNAREKPWALAVAWSAKAARVRLSTSGIEVRVHCFFPRPKRPTHPYPSRNDVDKLARSTLDALTGIAWRDDQQVVRLVATKRFVDEAEPNPGALIEIEEVAAW